MPVFYSLFDDLVTTPLWGRARSGLARLFSRLLSRRRPA